MKVIHLSRGVDTINVSDTMEDRLLDDYTTIMTKYAVKPHTSPMEREDIKGLLQLVLMNMTFSDIPLEDFPNTFKQRVKELFIHAPFNTEDWKLILEDI